jgi:hypothetical protein
MHARTALLSCSVDRAMGVVLVTGLRQRDSSLPACGLRLMKRACRWETVAYVFCPAPISSVIFFIISLITCLQAIEVF